VQHLRHAPGGQDLDHDMEDIFEGVDLSYEGDDVHFNAPDGHQDGAAELRKNEREDARMVEDGEGDHFPHFAEEFLVKVAADVLGRDATTFERIKLFQDGSPGWLQRRHVCAIHRS
jgi:hypothetical protein